jgi:Zn-dependent peptidase ImmA (M78 family)/transcriptional regulator with XRE-family HTH domain
VSNPSFSPSRLKVARQLAGLKQLELARLVELTPPALSQYETGMHIPSPPVLQRLAFSLGVPRDFFSAAGNESTPTPAFFRSLRSTPQMERDRAAAFSWLVARVAELVEADVRMPRCDLRLDLELSPTPGRADIEAAAAAAREAWGLPGGPVANVVRLLEARGAVVATFEDGDQRLSAFSQWHGKRPIVVFCLGKSDKARQRYDAAHELAHLALHSEPEPGNHVLEQQAEEFAAAFLMPADDVAPFLPVGRIVWDDLFVLKRVWGVSLQALLVRAHRLGTISDRTYQNAFRYMSRQGWRRREPVDLGHPEEPQLLKRAFALLARKGLTPADVFRQLALPERYLGALVGDSAAGAAAPVVALPRRRIGPEKKSGERARPSR